MDEGRGIGAGGWRGVGVAVRGTRRRELRELAAQRVSLFKSLAGGCSLLRVVLCPQGATTG